jgi:siroheme synthase
VHLGAQGLEVVRLKGGDPYVFGRGGEEADALRAAGIDCDVVPGISSAIAAPAAAGIPVTHRDASASFTVVTGHRRDGSDDSVQWEGRSWC